MDFLYLFEPNLAFGPCASDPCLNGATCFESFDGISFFCSCLEGWEGDTCDTPAADHCDPNPCMNGGTCTSSDSAFQCSCPSGFAGALCQLGTYLTRTIVQHLVSLVCTSLWELNLQRIVPLHSHTVTYHFTAVHDVTITLRCILVWICAILSHTKIVL